MIAKSRFTASSSKPVPQPTVKTEVEAVGEARPLGTSAANDRGTEGGARAIGGPVEAADTDAVAAIEKTCGEACALLGDPVEEADTDAAAEKKTCGEARAQGEALEAAVADAPAAAAKDVEARARGDPVEAADTDTAEAEE